MGRLFCSGNKVSRQWEEWFSSCSTSPLQLVRERVPGWQSHPSAPAGERLRSLIPGWLHGSPCTTPGTTARHLCYVNTPSALMCSAWNKLQRCIASGLQKKVAAGPEGKHSGFPPPRPSLSSAALPAWPSSDVRLPFRPQLSSARQGLTCSSFPGHLHHSRRVQQRGREHWQALVAQKPCRRTPAIAAGLCPAAALEDTALGKPGCQLCLQHRTNVQAERGGGN